MSADPLRQRSRAARIRPWCSSRNAESFQRASRTRRRLRRERWYTLLSTRLVSARTTALTNTLAPSESRRSRCDCQSPSAPRRRGGRGGARGRSCRERSSLPRPLNRPAKPLPNALPDGTLLAPRLPDRPARLRQELASDPEIVGRHRDSASLETRFCHARCRELEATGDLAGLLPSDVVVHG